MATTVTFAVNDQNDIYLDENGNIALLFDLEATLQACEQAVKMVLGEFVLDSSQGVPYFQTIFIGVPNVQIFNASIKQAILTVPGVIQVVTLETTVKENKLNYTAQIQTIFGIGSING